MLVNPSHVLALLDYLQPDPIVVRRSSLRLELPESLLSGCSGILQILVHPRVVRKSDLVEERQGFAPVVAEVLQSLCQNPPVLHGKAGARSKGTGERVGRVPDEHDFVAPRGEFRQFRSREGGELLPRALRHVGEGSLDLRKVILMGTCSVSVTRDDPGGGFRLAWKEGCLPV